MQVLVLEASTTSAKAMVCDSTGAPVIVMAEPYELEGSDPTVHDADSVVAASRRPRTSTSAATPGPLSSSTGTSLAASPPITTASVTVARCSGGN